MTRRILLVVLFMFQFSASAYSQTYGWKKIAQLENGLQCLFFLDSLHGCTAGTSGKIYRTTDGGYNWAGYSFTYRFVVYSISLIRFGVVVDINI